MHTQGVGWHIYMAFPIAGAAKSSPMSMSVRVVRMPSPRIHHPHCRKCALCTNPRSSTCSCAKLQHGSRSLAGAHPADGDTRNAGSCTRRPRPNSPASPTLQPPLPTCRDAQVGQTTRVRPLLRRTDKPPRASWLEAVHHFLCIPWARRAVPFPPHLMPRSFSARTSNRGDIGDFLLLNFC